MKMLAKRLEQYTVQKPEVLIVRAEVDGEEDEIVIFKGFSSSLMRPTAFDPEVSILPENAKIISIDRVVSPYNPNNPTYIERGLTWKQMEGLLSEIAKGCS
jgi:hypothetical protein